MEKFKNYAILVLVILLIASGIGLGIVIGSRNNTLETLNERAKEVKELREANKKSLENVKVLIDSVGIYQRYAEKQAAKTEKIHNEVKQIQHETQDKIKAIDSFSKSAHRTYFKSLVKRFYEDTIPY